MSNLLENTERSLQFGWPSSYPVRRSVESATRSLLTRGDPSQICLAWNHHRYSSEFKATEFNFWVHFNWVEYPGTGSKPTNTAVVRRDSQSFVCGCPPYVYTNSKELAGSVIVTSRRQMLREFPELELWRGSCALFASVPRKIDFNSCVTCEARWLLLIRCHLGVCKFVFKD